jgi:hypothetical protein
MDSFAGTYEISLNGRTVEKGGGVLLKSLEVIKDFVRNDASLHGEYRASKVIPDSTRLPGDSSASSERQVFVFTKEDGRVTYQGTAQE